VTYKWLIRLQVRVTWEDIKEEVYIKNFYQNEIDIHDAIDEATASACYENDGLIFKPTVDIDVIYVVSNKDYR
jgi:hypothetical protein